VKALLLNGVGKDTRHLDRIGELIVQELRSLQWEVEGLVLRWGWVEPSLVND